MAMNKTKLTVKQQIELRAETMQQPPEPRCEQCFHFRDGHWIDKCHLLENHVLQVHPAACCSLFKSKRKEPTDAK